MGLCVTSPCRSHLLLLPRCGSSDGPAIQGFAGSVVAEPSARTHGKSLCRGKAAPALLSSVSRHDFHTRRASGSGMIGTRICHLWNSSNLVSLFVSLGKEQVHSSGVKVSWQQGCLRIGSYGFRRLHGNLRPLGQMPKPSPSVLSFLLTWEGSWRGTILVRAAHKLPPTRSFVVLGHLCGCPSRTQPTATSPFIGCRFLHCPAKPRTGPWHHGQDSECPSRLHLLFSRFSVRGQQAQKQGVADPSALTLQGSRGD